MRMILILLALLVVGLLIMQQIDKNPQRSMDTVEVTNDTTVPAIPTKPQDVEAFGKNMDAFMNDAAAERAKRIEQAK